MKNLFKKIYFIEQFNPSVLGIFINPFYFARKALWSEIRHFSHQLNGRILDVGCGSKPYSELFRFEQYIGLEIDSEENRQNKSADFFYDGKVFPFEAGYFDSVVCNQVLEHVFEPSIFLLEINRVLKNDGKLLLTVPFVWDEHEQPWDYARYSSFGLRALLERNGFQLVDHKKTNADVRVLFQLINAYLYKVLYTSNSVLNLIVCILFIAPFNIFGLFLGKILPKNPDLYLDQVILVKKVFK